MAEKLKKGIPWFIILALIGLTVGIGFNFSFKAETQQLEPQEVKAGTATTSVTVGNDAPAWTAMYELPESSSSTPTNVALDVTFKGLANDPNDDDLWLVICTSDAISTTSNGAVPTCDLATWASAAASTTDNTPITVTYTTSEPDVEENDWWAWICDDVGDGDQLCSASSQGQGSTTVAYSPFVVNHQPIFNALTNDSPLNPNETIIWSTDVSTTDPDSWPADTVTLYICKSGGWTTSTDDCVGGEWASSSAVANNPSATHDDDDDIFPDDTYTANVWLIDNHGLEATGTIAVGASSDFTVDNVAPTISVATISLVDDSGGGNLSLDPAQEASSTPGFTVTATIVDQNSCQSNEISTGTAYAYRSGIGYSNCSTTADSNPNNCYPVISCTIGPCDGAADADATTSCSFALWFVADPTIGTSTWEGENWLASVKAQDDNNASTTVEGDTPNELEALLAMNLLDTAIAYGSVAGDAISTEATTTIEATGNIGLDINIDGLDMANNGNTIVIGQQHYSSTTGFAWADGAIASTSVQELEINCPKSISTSSPATSSAFWIIKVPAAQAGGTYTGTTTIAAKLGEPSDW